MLQKKKKKKKHYTAPLQITSEKATWYLSNNAV